MQGVHSNYEIDIFKQLIAKAADIIGVSDLESKSLRVIADHIRSCFPSLLLTVLCHQMKVGVMYYAELFVVRCVMEIN